MKKKKYTKKVGIRLNSIRKNPTTENFQKFICAISRLETIEFLGVVRILGIPLGENEKEERSFESLLSDVLDAYINLPRNRRKSLMRIVKAGAEDPTPSRNYIDRAQRKHSK